jgi:hypothetical protein
MSLETAIDRLRLAEADWTEALDAHVYAEPNPAFAERLRAMADAADRQHQAFEYAANERLDWDPLPHEPEGRPAPYELSVDSGRIGPPHLWQRFDRAFAAWDRSLEGTSIPEIARGFGALAAICRELADAVDVARPPIPVPGSGRKSA